MKHLLNYENGKIVAFDHLNGTFSNDKSTGSDVKTSGLFETVIMSENLRKWASVPVALYTENDSLILQISGDRWLMKSESVDVKYILLCFRKLIISVKPEIKKYFISSLFSLKWDGTNYVDIDDWPTPPHSLFEFLFSYTRTKKVDELINDISIEKYPIKWV